MKNIGVNFLYSIYYQIDKIGGLAYYLIIVICLKSFKKTCFIKRTFIETLFSFKCFVFTILSNIIISCTSFCDSGVFWNDMNALRSSSIFALHNLTGRYFTLLVSPKNILLWTIKQLFAGTLCVSLTAVSLPWNHILIARVSRILSLCVMNLFWKTNAAYVN